MEREVTYKHFNSISSTNDYAKDHLAQFDLSKLNVLSTDEQTAGRGTQGKAWLSPKGGLYLTFVVPFAQVPYQIGLVLAISCIKVLERHTFNPKIRWPNDLLIDGKKVGGILSEQQGDVLIVGVGINVATPQELLDTLDQSATSLRGLQPHELRTELIEQFKNDLSLHSMSGFSTFFPFYRGKIAYLGKQVRVTIAEKSHTGILKAVLPDGLLQLETAPDVVMTIVSGQIRPIEV